MRHEHLIAEAKRLAPGMAHEGEPPRHSDVLAAVAKAHGAPGWSELVASLRPTLRERLGGLFTLGGGRQPGSPVALDALLYPKSTENLLLGTCEATGQPHVQSLKNQCCHMLVAASAGSGGSTFVRDLMAQHIVRGGGLLFVEGELMDSHFDDLARVGKAVGRARDFLDASPTSAPDLVAAMLERRVIRYRDQPALGREQLMQYLRDGFWARMNQGREPGARIPFMVVVDANALGSAASLGQSFLAQARACGVSFVVTTQYGSPALEPSAEEVHANTWTKVFFKALDQKASAAAAQLVIRASAGEAQETGAVVLNEDVLNEKFVTGALLALDIGEYLLVAPDMRRRTGADGSSLVRKVRARYPSYFQELR
ncbi:hypothetical protein D3C71_24470 [compost metagenome]